MFLNCQVPKVFLGRLAFDGQPNVEAREAQDYAHQNRDCYCDSDKSDNDDVGVVGCLELTDADLEGDVQQKSTEVAEAHAHQRGQEGHEVLVVVAAYAVVDVSAVVVEQFYTVVACTAVVGSRWPIDLARVAPAPRVGS